MSLGPGKLRVSPVRGQLPGSDLTPDLASNDDEGEPSLGAGEQKRRSPGIESSLRA